MLVFPSDGQRKQNDDINLIGNTGFCRIFATHKHTAMKLPAVCG